MEMSWMTWSRFARSAGISVDTRALQEHLLVDLQGRVVHVSWVAGGGGVLRRKALGPSTTAALILVVIGVSRVSKLRVGAMLRV